MTDMNLIRRQNSPTAAARPSPHGEAFADRSAAYRVESAPLAFAHRISALRHDRGRNLSSYDDGASRALQNSA